VSRFCLAINSDDQRTAAQSLYKLVGGAGHAQGMKAPDDDDDAYK